MSLMEFVFFLLEKSFRCVQISNYLSCGLLYDKITYRVGTWENVTCGIIFLVFKKIFFKSFNQILKKLRYVLYQWHRKTTTYYISQPINFYYKKNGITYIKNLHRIL